MGESCKFAILLKKYNHDKENLDSNFIITFYLFLWTGFSLNAPYRDVTFVYGILDAQDSVHYLKIYKGLQTEGNPSEVVQDWTKLYYFDTISVTLTESKGGESTGRVITLDTTTSVPRSEGFLATQPSCCTILPNVWIRQLSISWKLYTVRPVVRL